MTVSWITHTYANTAVLLLCMHEIALCWMSVMIAPSSLSLGARYKHRQHTRTAYIPSWKLREYASLVNALFCACTLRTWHAHTHTNSCIFTTCAHELCTAIPGFALYVIAYLFIMERSKYWKQCWWKYGWLPHPTYGNINIGMRCCPHNTLARNAVIKLHHSSNYACILLSINPVMNLVSTSIITLAIPAPPHK